MYIKDEIRNFHLKMACQINILGLKASEMFVSLHVIFSLESQIQSQSQILLKVGGHKIKIRY